ncbi:iron complex transport system permease protein [Pseudooceanicola nitratireducens]|uniref:Iron complex transport system permease protein n=1 Tax=Pseudooceanicola nitratireducens TaxID=517719 RepID=A0A1I1J3F3_9RHOB|nr:Fe(3+)-hydroxamate ABC transporter permease FhuB [Pseudooceanicola nitratireducens]SEJ29074.1 iron complex transport system permease protein [Pseudooceanicola nitratireducens]SFC43077.1 iron complex transport system permease protein [Pseudooceanicola nitratireducens]
MTRARLPLLLALTAALALALTGRYAVMQLPPGLWPALPLDADGMSVDQILLAFGTLPRGVIALLAGAALGLSGALLQIVLRNPVADPTTLGISSGAQLALVLATILAPDLLALGRWPIALSGAGLATALVLAVGARRAFAPVTMVITGMLVGMTASAIATAVTLSQGQYLLSLVIWNGGSLVQQDWSGVATLALLLAVGALAAALLARPLRVLSLGIAGAAGLGVNVAAVRLAAVCVAVVLAAGVSAELGLIGFVGLAAPALARTLGARTIPQRLALSPLIGALILSLCDGLVLTLAGAGGEMFPTGALTGLIGGPLLIWLLPRLRGSTPPGTEAAEGPAPRLSRPLPLLGALVAALVVLALVLVWIGRVPGGWAILDAQSFADFLPMRLPRLIAAAAAGAALALAGAVLQRLTANPLASPEVLGVSGGASLGFAAVIYLVTGPGAALLYGGTIAGGVVALLLVALYVLRRDMPTERILLAGIAVSAFASAVLSAIMAAGDAKSWVILAWLSGSSAAVTLPGALGLGAVALALWLAALGGRRWLALLPLGTGVAGALGLPLRLARLLLIVLAGIATGAATILVGPLSFVGLMAPHMARRLGLARPEHHLSGAALIGALLMLTADFGARMAGFPYELPLGLFASLIGAPWLLWLLMRSK